MATRQLLVLLHRYVGLAMAGFLLMAGLTGSLLAWNDELEALVSPQLFHAERPPGAQPLDPLQLRDAVAALYPHATVRFTRLVVPPGGTLRVRLAPLPGTTLANDEVFVNAYTGAVLGERRWGDITQGPKNLMPFVYRLHDSLALGEFGTYVVGVVALLWTLDCFVGAWLTLPLAQRAPARRPPGRSWPARWSPAWRIRVGSGASKLNFDLHRAGGLWLWAMLLVIAWSSVAFNLAEVHDPVMRSVLRHQPTADDLPVLAQPLAVPAMSWQQARDTGRRLMAEQAQAHGFIVVAEHLLAHDAARGVFRYAVRSSLDIRERSGETSLLFDAGTGQFKSLWLPTGAAGGDTVREWTTSLHRAALWGRPLKIFVCLVGMAVAMLSLTGVLIWWKKRRARRATAR